MNKLKWWKQGSSTEAEGQKNETECKGVGRWLSLVIGSVSVWGFRDFKQSCVRIGSGHQDQP